VRPLVQKGASTFSVFRAVPSMARVLREAQALFSGVLRVLESMDEVVAESAETLALAAKEATQRVCRPSKSGAKADVQLCR
jgi:hypothetical protein